MKYLCQTHLKKIPSNFHLMNGCVLKLKIFKEGKTLQE